MITKQTNNLKFLEELDKEWISLDDYIFMLIEKKLMWMWAIEGKNLDKFIKEIDA